MGILSRATFFEITRSALLGTLLFTFILFLRSLRKLFEQLVRGEADPAGIAELAGLVFIPTLTFAVPVGVLVGILIGLSRKSTDNEITAMRASGIPARRLLWPVMALGLTGCLIAAAASLWLTPWSIRETYRVLNQMAATQLTAEIQPQVFDEQFPNTILYVGEVVAGPVVRWRKVFLADLTPAEERNKLAARDAQGPRVTFAEEALAVADPANNRIQLTFRNPSTHEVGNDPSADINTMAPAGDQALEAQKPEEKRSAKPLTGMDTMPLAYEAYYGAESIRTEALIELHQRLALPLACVVFALVGLPLGAVQRRGGKSVAFILTVLLGFVYYMGYISLIGLARQGSVRVELAVWLPNLLMGLLGVGLLVRLERPGDFELAGLVQGWVADAWRRLRRLWPKRPGEMMAARRFSLLPLVIDGYVLSSFLFYLALLLASFILLTDIFTFFELLSDIVRNKIPLPRVGAYLFFLTPKLIYDLLPVSVLVATLVTFGVMAKNNEVIAMRACGVSLHRLAFPVMLCSLVLSGSLFAFDYYFIPDANRKQDAIRNEIKGRPPATYLNPNRKYVYGQGSRIYYYKYFDPAQAVMADVSVYEINPKLFRLDHVISAEKARWEPSLGTWVFQNGFRRSFEGVRVKKFDDFRGGASSYGHLNEPPSYFLKEVKLSSQMNFRELADYVRELQQSGFDTTPLQVQYHGKFAVPLFAFIMALIASPFAFSTGNRGAMAGAGVSLAIAITYLTVGKLFEAVGNLSQLPAPVAAWAPDSLFALAGAYLLLRLRT